MKECNRPLRKILSLQKRRVVLPVSAHSQPGQLLSYFLDHKENASEKTKQNKEPHEGKIKVVNSQGYV